MPRPIMPAPMTAIVSTAGTLLVHLFEVSDRGIHRRAGGAQVLGQTFALFRVHTGNIKTHAAQSGRNVIDVIHRANKFTSRYYHESSSFFVWNSRKIRPSLFRVSARLCRTSILDAPSDLVKETSSRKLCSTAGGGHIIAINSFYGTFERNANQIVIWQINLCDVTFSP